MKMKNETQALHLARIMKKHIQTSSYELALPLVMLQNKKLKKLNVNDVLLTGFEKLEFLLIDGNSVCANIRFENMENIQKPEIVNLLKDPIKPDNGKKYKTIKISFGTVQSKVLELGHPIDMTHINFEKVTIVLNDKTIAEGSLVMVDEEIAIQIKKVK